MVKTKGAVDRVKRKTRKDKGKKKRKISKKTKFIPYVSSRRGDEPIKLWFWKVEPMSLQGYHKFSQKTRRYMRKTIYKPTLRVDVDPNRISNKEKLESLCLEHLWVGTWLIMGWSRGRTKTKVKPVKMAKVVITDHPTGLQAKLLNNYRLYRYRWFWEKK